MAVRTPAEIRAQITQYIIENYNGEITGEQVRSILTDIIDTFEPYLSVGALLPVADEDVDINTGGTWVEYPKAFPEGTKVVPNVVEIIGTNGARVLGYSISQDSATRHLGFTIYPMMAGKLKYTANPIIL